MPDQMTVARDRTARCGDEMVGGYGGSTDAPELRRYAGRVDSDGATRMRYDDEFTRADRAAAAQAATQQYGAHASARAAVGPVPVDGYDAQEWRGYSSDTTRGQATGPRRRWIIPGCRFRYVRQLPVGWAHKADRYASVRGLDARADSSERTTTDDGEKMPDTRRFGCAGIRNTRGCRRIRRYASVCARSDRCARKSDDRMDKSVTNKYQNYKCKYNLICAIQSANNNKIQINIQIQIHMRAGQYGASSGRTTVVDDRMMRDDDDDAGTSNTDGSRIV